MHATTVLLNTEKRNRYLQHASKHRYQWIHVPHVLTEKRAMQTFVGFFFDCMKKHYQEKKDQDSNLLFHSFCNRMVEEMRRFLVLLLDMS
jgi:hypothetical protein